MRITRVHECVGTSGAGGFYVLLQFLSLQKCATYKSFLRLCDVQSEQPWVDSNTVSVRDDNRGNAAFVQPRLCVLILSNWMRNCSIFQGMCKLWSKPNLWKPEVVHMSFHQPLTVAAIELYRGLGCRVNAFFLPTDVANISTALLRRTSRQHAI